MNISTSTSPSTSIELCESLGFPCWSALPESAIHVITNREAPYLLPILAITYFIILLLTSHITIRCLKRYIYTYDYYITYVQKTTPDISCQQQDKDQHDSYHEWMMKKTLVMAIVMKGSLIRPGFAVVLLSLFQYRSITVQLYSVLFIVGYIYEIGFLSHNRRYVSSALSQFVRVHHTVTMTIFIITNILINVNGNQLYHDNQLQKRWTLFYRFGWMCTIWEWGGAFTGISYVYKFYIEYYQTMELERRTPLQVVDADRLTIILARAGNLSWSWIVTVFGVGLPDMTLGMFLVGSIPGFIMNGVDLYFTIQSLRKINQKIQQLKQQQQKHHTKNGEIIHNTKQKPIELDTTSTSSHHSHINHLTIHIELVDDEPIHAIASPTVSFALTESPSTSPFPSPSASPSLSPYPSATPSPAITPTVSPRNNPTPTPTLTPME